MRVAYHRARRLLPEHSCKFSRHDFTLAHLFACLVVREFFGLSFRRTEALLIDSPAWLADINLAKAPDHNTLWRAFESLLSTRRCSSMLDLLAGLFAKAKLLPPRRRSRTLAMDSTCSRAAPPLGPLRPALPADGAQGATNARESGAKPSTPHVRTTCVACPSSRSRSTAAVT